MYSPLFDFGNSKISRKYADWCSDQVKQFIFGTIDEMKNMRNSGKINEKEFDAACHATMAAIFAAGPESLSSFDAAEVASKTFGSAISAICATGISVNKACARLDKERFRILDCLNSGDNPYP